MSGTNFLSGTVVVLLGGRSPEREVSLRTGEACARALESKGIKVQRLDPGVDLTEPLGQRLSKIAPAAVFNALHGTFGEDGCVQGLLEEMQIPYTGSGVLASALGMSKVASKRIFHAAGLQTPPYEIISAAKLALLERGEEPPVKNPGPWVVKPDAEGSSVGVTIVHEQHMLREAILLAGENGGDVLVEAFISGRELSVAVLDGQALGIIEIVPSRPFYDYEAKYASDSGTKYLFPAPLDEVTTKKVYSAAERAFEVLGCKGVIRPDFIITPEGSIELLEVNTLPGMTATSLVPKIAAGMGIEFPELCMRLLEGASLGKGVKI